MCGIFGIGLLANNNFKNSEMFRRLIKMLFIENELRGRTAAGLACVFPDKIKVLKTNVNAGELIRLPEYMQLENTLSISDTTPIALRPLSIIGHTRLKTKGSELVNANNHPIVRNDVVGVHNGCLFNDDELFRNREFLQRNGEVDSEIIFAQVEYNAKTMLISEAIESMGKDVSGAFACAMAHRNQPYMLWLFRRDSPCEVMVFKKTGLIVWSSVMAAIDKAVAGLELGAGERLQFPADSGIEIDLLRNKIYRFDVGICTTKNGYINYY